jgi:hypothetical protein
MAFYSIRSYVRIVVFLVPCFFSGCFYAGVGGLAVLVANNGSDGRTTPNTNPQAVIAAVNEQLLGDVNLSFTISDAEGDPAAVTLFYSFAGGPFLPCTAASGSPDNSQFVTSAGGREGSFVWDASTDLMAVSETTAVIRVVASQVNPAQSSSDDSNSFRLGNVPAFIVASPSPDPSSLVNGRVVGSVVIKFNVRDSLPDPFKIAKFQFSTDGGNTIQDIDPATIVGGIRPGAVSQTASVGGSSQTEAALDFTWNTQAQAELRDKNINGVKVFLTPADVFAGQDQQGVSVESTAFDVDNNDLPVGLIDTTQSTDSDGSIRVFFQLQDNEADNADIVLQWSTDVNNFPSISDLTDASLRQRALTDADERAPRQILTPFARTILEARTSSDGSSLPVSEVALTGIQPGIAFDNRLIGATLELISDTGAIEDFRTITAVNAAARSLTLSSAFSVPQPRRNQRVRIRTAAAFINLTSSMTAPGNSFDFTWDASFDLGVQSPDTKVFLRATAFVENRMGPISQPVFNRPLTTTSGLQFTPAPTPTLTTGSSPESVIAADVDGDGALDLISADSGSDRLSIFINNGAGSFQSANLIATGGDPEAVAAADVDGDGDLDLISADSSSNRLSIFINNGAGSFQLTNTIMNRASPKAVVAVDIDEDGDVDLISADSGSMLLSILINDGSGSFSASSTISVTNEPEALITADVDGDKKVDLICAFRFGTSLSIFMNNGSGGFSTSPTTISTGSEPRSVSAADVNGDGAVDLISASFVEDQLLVFMNNGSGGFSTPNTILNTGTAPRVVVSADINGDGHVDLLSADRNSNQLSLFVGDGSGAFVVATPATIPIGVQAEALIAADIDGNGQVDLISADSGSQQLSLFLNARSASFSPSISLPIDSAAKPRFVIAGDINGDKNIDLISADDSGSGQLSVFLGDGLGAFPVASRSTLNTGGSPQAVTAADIDGDGNIDLISADSGSNQLSIFTNMGSGSLQSPVTIATGSSPQAVTAADIDGDGNIDLISADSGSNQLSIFTNMGSGLFQPTNTITTGNSPQAVTAVDVDGDGNIDLISADRGADQLSIFINDGSGAFNPVNSSMVMTGTDPDSVITADIDRDGDLDLICSDRRQSNQLSIFINDGSGAFSAANPIPAGNDPRSVTAADVDGDGDVDLISAERVTKRVSVFLNDGSGVFRLAIPTLPTGRSTETVTTADVNGDGHVDLISGVTEQERLAVFLNLNSDNFSPLLFGTPRVLPPSTGNALGAALVLSGDPMNPITHRIDTSAGTINGVKSAGFQGHSFHFSSVTVEQGAIVQVVGEFPLSILATGDIIIDGELRCDGRDGASASSTNRLLAGNQGGSGGHGGPAAGAGGGGGGSFPGSGAVRGQLGFGGGSGGVAADTSATDFSGAGGSFASRGGDVASSSSGPVYGNTAMMPLYGGSGGGGGKANDTASNGLNTGDEGSGGGGGGGGAARLISGGTLTVNGKVTANGGGGGAGKGTAGNGGGGSGGSVLLQAVTKIVINPGASIEARGGNGGSGGNASPGGVGGNGRIRFESDNPVDSNGTVTVRNDDAATPPDLGPLTLP